MRSPDLGQWLSERRLWEEQDCRQQADGGPAPSVSLWAIPTPYQPQFPHLHNKGLFSQPWPMAVALGSP